MENLFFDKKDLKYCGENDIKKLTRILYLGQKPIGEICFTSALQYQGDNLQIFAACSNLVNTVWWKTHNIYDSCRNINMEFVDNTKRNEHMLMRLIKKHAINMIISVQHPWILSHDILAAVQYNAYNLHLAKLPEYKV